MSQNVLKDDNTKTRFPARPETKATNLLLNQLDKLFKKDYEPQTSLSPEVTLQSPKLKLQTSGNTPIAKRTRKAKVKPQSSTLHRWLSKSTPIESFSNKKPVKSNQLGYNENKNSEKNGSTSMSGTNKVKNKGPKFTRNSSNESFSDLPVFSTKSTQKSIRKSKSHDKSRGLPKLKDILEEQNNLIEYKKQVTEAQTLKEPYTEFQITLSPKKKKRAIVLLDCKHLTFEELDEVFKENVQYLEDIISGKKYNERHNRFKSYNMKKYNQTTKDLTYNTSMIVFSYEQIEHMTSLMAEHFDSEDNMSTYFFKVLLPELCLKVFMDCHNMSRREATAYLESRPVD